MSEIELIQPVNLCDTNGSLNPAAVGWSRKPLHTCNLSKNVFRKKRWNYWCITTPEFLFSATLSNIDYMGLAFIYFLDFKTNEFHEQTVMSPFGKQCDLPDIVGASVHFLHKDLSLKFQENNTSVDIQVNSPKFAGRTLSADLTIARPENHESLNVVIPWSKNRFQFTSKQNCLPAAGKITIGNKVHTANPESSYGCLDFGRGIWRYSSVWNWACFSSSEVGANLGGRWTDGTGYNENGLTIYHTLHKIGHDVEFIYNSKDYMQPWQIRTKNSNQIDLVFTPFFERVARTNFIILASEVHQMIGRFSGTVQSNNGEQIRVDDLIGWAEDHHARW